MLVNLQTLDWDDEILRILRIPLPDSSPVCAFQRS
jgi:glycerol kinase